MTDGIGRIGGSNYGYVGFGPQKKNENGIEQNATPQTSHNKENLLNPEDVMNFLNANNNIFAPKEVTMTTNLDEATINRIEDYMANFEGIYAVIANEFGEEVAPKLLNLAMDPLMGVA